MDNKVPLKNGDIKKNKLKVAIRRIDTPIIDPEYRGCVDREILLLPKLCHRHVVRTFDCFGILPNNFDYYIIQEWLPENLRERVDRGQS